jgi:geranylgeranyl diphosphate synthase type I
VIDEAVAELLPRDVDEAYLGEFFGDPTYRYDAPAIQRALADPIWDLLDRGGKRWRAVVFCLLVDGFGADPRELLPYACIPEVLHNGTIIVDDVEDEASIRRGEPALHHGHGTDVALNAGNAMYFLPLKVITRNPADLAAETRLEAYEMLKHELNRTQLGQGIDIYWHNEREVRIGEEEYLEMCACKTGCLGRIVARLAAIVTEQPESAQRTAATFLEEMCIAFQIADDVLDVEHSLEGGDEAFGKEFGNDVREGKKTLMVIHAAEHAPAEAVARLEEILWRDDNTDDEIEEALDILVEAGSVSYARERANDIAASAREHLAELDVREEPKEKLAAFCRFVVEREA